MPNLFSLPTRPDPSTLITPPSLAAGNFQNDGNIWSTSDGNVGTALYGNNSGTITNSGLVVSEAPIGNAYGIWVSSRMVPPLINSGSIFAIAGGNASAISLWEPSALVNNSGTIAAYAPTENMAGVGSATGLGMFNGGYLENGVTGSILAEGLWATAVIFSRGSLYDTFGPQIVNAGRIEAYSLDPSHRSIAILTSVLDVEFFSIVNSGLIRADVAYRSDSVYYSPPQGSRDQITNLAGGQIIGRIETDLGDDQIFNSGAMSGQIALGAGADFYDGTQGSQSGGVFGEGGHDVLRGGSGLETFYGGDGDDILTGGLGVDWLFGGNGYDTFVDTAAGLNGDKIDFTGSDRIIITDANLAGFTASISGLTLNYTGGSVNLAQAYTGQLTISAAVGGGVQISVGPVAPIQDASNDFNGDGRSDIIARQYMGRMYELIGTPSGGFAFNPLGDLQWAPTDWRIVGTGDFNGDGRDDLLWRSLSGSVSNWLANRDGSFSINDSNAFANIPTSWSIVGTGDFNGDGRDDILWRNAAGTISNWLGTSTGGFVINDANASNFVPNDWQVAAVGDFNGDGRDDILWRNTDGTISNWLGNSAGGYTVNDANAMTNVDNVWIVIGVGDFNGDGRDDILWERDISGDISNWLATANGGFVQNDVNAFHGGAPFWKIAGIGDYNGDGRDDILWEGVFGNLSNWLGTASGGYIVNDANAAINEPSSWQPFDWGWI